MHSRYLPVILVLLSPLVSAAQNCEADQAAFRQISTQLEKTRAGIQKNEADLAYIGPIITNAIDERNAIQSAMEVMEKDSYKAKAAKAMMDEFNRKIEEFRQNEARMKQDLSYLKNEEPILLNSYHLVRDRLDKNCGGVKKNEIPNVEGDYIAPTGTARIVQTADGKYLSCTLWFNGGSSTLTGNFDGTTWTYDWKSTYNHYGNGVMTYTKGFGFNGWWVDKFYNPPSRGDLRFTPK